MSVVTGYLNYKNQKKALQGQQPWNDARNSLLGRAGDLASRKYEGYKGERVAGLSVNEQKGVSMARTGFDASRGYLDQAGRTVDSVAKEEWNPETQKKYMDPYIGGVVDIALKKEKSAYDQEQNALRSKLGSVGAFGGSRGTLLEVGNTGKHLETVGDITTKGYSDAYNTAFQNWQSDKQSKLAAAQAFQSVGGDLSRLSQDNIDTLMKTGQSDRLIRQFTNDTMYDAFIERRDWDLNNLQPLLQAVSSTNPGGAVVPQLKVNTAETIGAVMSLVGYFGGKGGGGGGGTDGVAAAGGGSFSGPR